MLHHVYSKNEKHSMVLEDFDGRIRDWFSENIGMPTELQRRAWSEISSGQNVLVVSPTGTGKTLSAVIPPVNDILIGRSKRSKTSIIHISPMKALGADLVKTLEVLSEGLGRIEGKKERKWGRGRKRKNEILEDARLHVGIRTGDVSQTERRHMLLDPPDILVTTPENLLLMLCSKARETLSDVRYVIIDEVHEMVPTKRGALLSLCVEYLNSLIESGGNEPPVRIGLSATVRPDRTAAGFLGGKNMEGRARDVRIIRETSTKVTNISIRTLIGSMEGGEDVLYGIIDDIGELMETEKGAMVIFHNTRRSAEKTAYRLLENGHGSVMPHHGSLGLDIRRAAEEGLKKGDLKAIVSSTSLELGLDIGLVDLVCQISSPKEPGRLLQRLGRSGHTLKGSSRGIIYPVNGPDLIESLAVVRAAQKGKLERLKVPDKPLDVLGQFIIGLSLKEGGADTEEIWKLARSAYPFKDLKKKELGSVLELLSKRLRGPGSASPRLWHGTEKGSYFPRRNTKQAFYLNCGTIPKETTYRVVDEKNHRHLGELSKDFGETLYERDVILMGSRALRIIGFSGSKIIVKEEPDAQPTVPSWSGEVHPRSLDVSQEILRLVRDGRSFTSRSAGGITVRTDPWGRALFREMINTMREEGIDLSKDRIPVEEVRAGRTKRIYIFHIPLGRNITEPLARYISYGIRKELGAKADFFAVDNGFSITSPRKLDEGILIRTMASEDFQDTIKELVLGSSLFRTRFAHCLAKSLLVLTRFRGKETSNIYRRSRTDRLLKRVTDAWYSEGGWDSVTGPMSGLVLLAEESFKEVFNERVDLENCERILADISSGAVELNMIEDLRKPSTLGRDILGNLKGIHERYLKKEDLDHDIGRKGEPTMFDEYVEHETGMHPSTTGDNEGSHPGPEVPSWNELEEQGLGWIDPDTVDIFRIKRSELARERFERTFQMGGPVSTLKKVPFVVHPVSALTRSGNGTYRDLRSAVKSGRLSPGRMMSMNCMMDPKWKKAAEMLSPASELHSKLAEAYPYPSATLNRYDIGEVLEQKGDELTSTLQLLLDCNEISRYPQEAGFHLGAPEGFQFNGSPRDRQGETDDDDIEVLISFLRRFGPFTIAEISMIFNWPEGEYPPAVENAYGLGRLRISLGPRGLACGSRGRGDRSNELWLISEEPVYPLPKGVPAITEPVVLPSTDPSVALISPDDNWIEEERVRGARNRKFSIITRGGYRTGFCHLLESSDTIRVVQVEVEDYELIGPSAEALLRMLACFDRLGYEIFTIEGFLGIPAGEAADTAVDLLTRNGFSRFTIPKGQILVRGCPVRFGISRERLLLEMMKRQGLLPGHNMKHPLEVITKLGSLIDRWEMLSRLGSVRYSKLANITDEEISRIIKTDRARLKKQLKKGPSSYMTDWNENPSRGTERLSDQKDLTKRFSLRRGKMDQTSDVWSLLEMFLRYPGPSSPPENPDPGVKEIKRKVFRGQLSELDGFIRTHGFTDTAENLLKQGYLLQDAWGKYEYPFRDGRLGGEPLPSLSNIPRGLEQSIWVLKNCNNLGCFTLEDMLNYSPDLTDRSKLRRIMNSLAKDNLKRFLSPDLGMRVVYSLPDIQTDMQNKNVRGTETDDLMVISPKDRMSKVVSSDIKIRLSRVSGFSVFRGTKAVALVSLKKMRKAFKNTGFGEPVKGASHLENYIIKKAWVDLRYRKKDLLREIKRTFFNMGYQLVTDDERTKIEALYRDIEKKERLE